MPPKKKFKVSKSNPASHINSFADLGINFLQPDDNVIRHDELSSDGRRINTTTTVAPRLRERVYTTVEPQDDWSFFEHPDMDNGHPPSHNFVFQVKKGRVIKVGKRKLFASVSCWYYWGNLLTTDHTYSGQTYEDIYS